MTSQKVPLRRPQKIPKIPKKGHVKLDAKNPLFAAFQAQIIAKTL